MRLTLTVVAALAVAAFAKEFHPADAATDAGYRVTLPMVARDQPPGPSVPAAFLIGDAAANCDVAKGSWSFSGRFYDAYDRSAFVFPDALTIVRAEHTGPGTLSSHPDILVSQDGTFAVELPVTATGEYTLVLQSVLVPAFHYLIEVSITGESAFTYRYRPGCTERRW